MKLIRQKGQVALIMVLIMTVISALVISFAGRATTETRIQNMLSDSTNAFLAARSGIEDAIQKSSADPIVGTLENDKIYKVSGTEEGREAVLVESLSSGSSVEILIGDVVNLTGAKVYWHGDGDVPASILVSVVTDTKTIDYAYDGLGLNGFTKVAGGGSLLGFAYDYVTPEVVFPANTNLMRITVYGSTVKLGVLPVGANFSAQSVKYRSVGEVGGGDSTIKYGLEYEESKLNKVPEVFNYALFSRGTIIQ